MKFNLETPESATPSDFSPEVNEGVRDVSDKTNDASDYLDYLQNDLEICQDSLKEINAREYGLQECIDSTIEIFSPEVIDEWWNYSCEQKSEITNEYAKAIADGLNINFEGAIIEEMDEYTYGYTNGDGYIHLNENMLDCGLPYSLANTIAHELRHQFQFEAMVNPEKFGIDEASIKAWEYGESTYWYQIFDPETYYTYNPLELDSRYFGEYMVNELLKNNINQNA